MQKDFFYKKSKPTSLKEVIKALDVNAVIIGDDKLVVDNVAPLATAKRNDITFFHNPKYIEALKVTNAGACVLSEEHVRYSPKDTALVVTQKPHLVYALLLEKFYPDITQKATISKSANIDYSAKIGKNCSILDNVVIGKNVTIGDGVCIASNSLVSDNVTIGEGTRIGSSVTIAYAIIGKNCDIYSGVRIGQDGFGFVQGGIKVNQVGIVEIGNNVEIGANTCIDKGTLESTIIGDNCKIDNLVQIAHNVEIGCGTIIAAQVGISGSTKIGKNVMLGGQTGIAGHLKIGDGAMSAGKSGITSDVSNGVVVAGYPAIKINNWHRQNIFLKKQIKKS
jgi:UDP-3-O-[3-hydroxymyristoyl] glucosamine N-acyltransferase